MARQSSRLQSELQQRRPFDSVHQEAALALLKTADRLRRAIALTLEPHGVTPQQYNVLRILRGAGASGIATLAIGERLIEEAPGMTRLLDRLEAKGLVKRERCPDDRRQVLCWLSQQGARALNALDASVQKAATGLDALDNDQAETLVDFLERIRERQEQGKG